MKTKPLVYLILVFTGVIFLVWGENWMPETVALSLGFVCLFAGIYLTSRTYGSSNQQDGNGNATDN